MRAAILAGAVAMAGGALPGVAQSQTSFSPPSGCTGILTVQHRQCLLYNIWTCEADPEGIRWSGLFEEEGLSVVRKIDNESQWLARYYVSSGAVEELQMPSVDPMSLTELFEAGIMTFDYTMLSFGAVVSRSVGFDKLNGVETVIDGEPLLEFEFQTVNAADGPDARVWEGRQYVSERHRLFIVNEFWPADDPSDVTAYTPVDFIYPGEPGFFASMPVYDCGAVLSGLDAPAPTDGADILRTALTGD